MAQNITLMGASYTDVPGVQLPKTGGGTALFSDASVTTATAADVAQGKLFLASDGTITTGTASGGGGGSDWTKVAEVTYKIKTTSTSATTHTTWSTGSNALWTSDKWVYVRIRDTAGKREGYFYGSDQFFYNVTPVNGTSETSITSSFRVYTKVPSGGAYSAIAGTSTTGYGVWADTLYSDGRIRIRKRYNATSSQTVDGDFKIEAFILNPPGGTPIFV